MLRLVLYNLWSSRCYWCHRPKDFNDIQIDHILPRDLATKDREDLIANYGLPEDFDFDDSRNLAPICSACNGTRGKGKNEYGDKPVYMEQLRRAGEFRSTVIEQVLSFGNSKRVAEYLLRVSKTDLSDPKARQAFERHAPAIVQKLALLDEARVDYVSFRTKTVTVNGENLEVGFSLDNRGRTAVAILESVCECAVTTVLEERVVELVSIIRRKTQTEFEDIEGPAGPTSSGAPESLFMRIDIDSVNYERWTRFMEFTFSGAFEASLSASLVQDNWDGIGLNEIQGDAQVSGTFSFAVTWDFSAEPGDVEVSECAIDKWKADVG
ncbi:hypothetical protein ACIBI3_29665 [Actinomadura luteofluorescens]|uniref:hypothetical protein n=1 Tax=Actinomadura luteofluorescens TaxID=46163 RepID=UPI00346D5B5C